MNKLFFPIAFIFILSACNNSKKEKQTSSDSTSVNTNPVITDNNTSDPGNNKGNVTCLLADTARTLNGSVLVEIDKDKVSPGNDKIAIVTASNDAGESVTLNFVFSLKPGVYPVVGLGITKGEEVYGGILGGEEKITPYKLTLTECTDLGSNNIGGHKWKISGSVDQDMTIDAMPIMKLSPGHPDAVKLSKYQFTNLTFDDNMEQILEKIKN